MKQSLIFLLTVLAVFNYAALHAEIITNPPRSDGFGAQFQTIIYAAIYAELTNNEFRYTPFISMEHNYENDEEFLSQKEDLIRFIGNFPINNDPRIQAKVKPRNLIRFFESNIEKCVNSRTLKKIKAIFRENKKRTDYYFDGGFHIAVHIRRVNVHDIEDRGQAITDQDYLKIINSLREKYAGKQPFFHLFSQERLRDFKKIFNEKAALS